MRTILAVGMMIILQLSAYHHAAKPGYVTCWDRQGHRVEFVVFRPPSSQVAFCLARGLQPGPTVTTQIVGWTK